MTDTRTYIRLHDGMPDHPKIDALSDKAFRLLIESWCWCSRHLTDGFIPKRTWDKRGTAISRGQLIEMGLVEPVEGGVQMHDYLEHQRSADEVAELREKRAQAGRRGGLARSKRQASAKAIAKQPAKQNPSIDRDIDRTASNEAVASGGAASDGAPESDTQGLVAEWLERCTSRPPNQVIGQTSKHIKQMLAEGIPTGDVRAGLAAWHRKGLHPATLASVVHEVRVAAPSVITDDSQLPPVETDWRRRRL